MSKYKDTGISLGVILVVVLIYALFCEAFYGDWTCVIGDCRRVREVAP